MNAPLSPMLGRLAAERATGALLRDTGALYLREGAVVHAESPAAPGIEVLLTVGGRLPAVFWREAVDRAGDEGRIAHHLLEHHRLAAGEWEINQVGAVFDAAFFVLAPGGGPTRFRHGATHWFGAARPVDVARLERETRRRRHLLDALHPCPRLDTAPVVRRRARPAAPVPRRQAAVLELADGERTPAAITALLGRPAFHTLVDLRRLAAAGHIETPRGKPPAVPAVPAGPGEAAGDPDTALLVRLRDALEARL